MRKRVCYLLILVTFALPATTTELVTANAASASAVSNESWEDGPLAPCSALGGSCGNPPY